MMVHIGLTVIAVAEAVLIVLLLLVIALLAKGWNARLVELEAEVKDRTEEGTLRTASEIRSFKAKCRGHFAEVMMYWSPLVRKLSQYQAWDKFPKGDQPFELAQCGEALKGLGVEVDAVPQEWIGSRLGNPDQTTQF